MNRSTLLIAGIVGSFALSTFVLILVPQMQLGGMQPQFADDEGKITDIYPIENRGVVHAGRAVYISEGCIYCHSQQVRDVQNGADLERGWGIRRTVARDYMFDKPHLLGTMRTGPDLANIGARQKSRDWHYLHLYNPQITSAGSIMPQFPFLFNVVSESRAIPSEAVKLPEKWATTPTYIVPKDRAKYLVDYLITLDKSYDVPEAH